MRAAYFKEHGGADKILYGDYPDPMPAAGDVVVRVRACALNQVDMLLLDGRFPPPEGLPHVNGCEVTGTVEATGPAVKGLAPGARVVIFPGFPNQAEAPVHQYLSCCGHGCSPRLRCLSRALP